MAPDAVVTEWLPAARRPSTGWRIPCACRAGRAELRPGARHRDGDIPDASDARCLGSVRPAGPLAVVAAGLLVVRLLRYRVTIDDCAGAP